MPLPQRCRASFAPLLLTSLLGCKSPPASSPQSIDQPVVIAKVAPRVGRVAIEETTLDLTLSAEVKANGGLSHITSESTQHERKREEILAVFDRIVTKKRVTFELIERHETRDGATVATAKSPIAGRTYLVELKSSMVVFATPSGTPLSNDEQTELGKRFANFGKPDPFLEGIPDGPLQANQPAQGMAEGFLETFEGGDDGPDVGKVAVHFAGARNHEQGRCGVFQFTVRAQLAGEPRLDADLQGEFLLRLEDGAPVDLEMSGPTRLAGRQTLEGVDVQLDGSGQMRGSWKTRYLAR